MRAILKLISLFILPTLVLILSFFYLKSQTTNVLVIEETSEKSLSVPYQYTLYEEFGMIYTPNIILAVKTPTGFKNYNFLIDTGAIVSALPAKESQYLGINLAYLPRVAVEGYGGQTTFTYRGSFSVKILDELVSLPCVFSEFDASNYILGRKGIVDRYTVTFNVNKKAVEFIKK